MARQWPMARLVLDRDWVTALVDPAAYAATAVPGSKARKSGSAPKLTSLLEGAKAAETCPVFVSVSRRGSVVVVNVPPGERVDRHPLFSPSALIASVPNTPLPAEAPFAAEELSVTFVDEAQLDPGAWYGFRGGTLEVRGLCLDSVRVLNSCLAQTVNLQFFEGQVDGMHDTVREIHAAIEAGDSSGTSLLADALDALGAGTGPRLSTGMLYRQLAGVNAISNQIVLSGLRNTVRPGSTAWKGERYSDLQELLWDELDLEERYDELQRKLGFVNETIRYSLDMAKDAKAIFLERVIVLLIAAELALSLLNTGLLAHVADAAFDAAGAVAEQLSGVSVTAGAPATPQVEAPASDRR